MSSFVDSPNLFRSAFIFAGLFSSSFFYTTPIFAAPNDISLVSLVERDANGNPILQNGIPQPRLDDFRALSAEVGAMLTPTALWPADTTGIAGFDFAVETAFHDINESASYWQDATQRSVDSSQSGVRDPSAPPFLTTLGFRGRKGFILPAPLTSEIELGAAWVVDSRMVNLGGSLKVALNEGFSWLPDVALTAGANRLVGSEQLDLFSLNAGGSISKSFSVVGDFAVTPFVSYQTLFINAASRVLDGNPNDTGDVGRNFVFSEIQFLENRHDRVSAGARIHWAVLSLTAGVDVNLLHIGSELVYMPQYGVRAGLMF